MKLRGIEGNGMLLENKTEHNLDFLHGYVSCHDTHGLRVKVAYTKLGARCPYSGRFHGKRGRIRVSINSDNSYPLEIVVGSPFNRANWRKFTMWSARELVAFVFLHELSHFLDHQRGLPLGCKQTKADMFALRKMGKVR